jgi:sugar/nucleoside kinase (ribokinase family)
MKDRLVNAEYSVFGMENPLFDRIAGVEFAVLETLQAPKGTMNLVGYEEMQRVLSLAGRYRSIPGGSCANTVRAIASLSQCDPVAPTVYSGAVGNDPAGDEYERIMRCVGIETRLVRKNLPTGCSVILVTPDRERTMFTYLGACREFTAEDVDVGLLARASYLHITGYLWDTDNQRQAVALAGETARRHGVRVAFDLADPYAVRRYHRQFLEWIPGAVDVLFGNRDEFRLMLGGELTDVELAGRAGELSAEAILKIGPEGCLVNDRGRVRHIPGFPVHTVDTTAAGDCFAAGYLYARLKGLEPERSARLANRLASWVVTVEGCDLEGLDADEVVRSGQ